MSKQRTKNMTEGSPMKLILSFSVPLLLGNIFQQLYNLVDTIIVGKYLGLSALSSVGATGSLMFLVIGFCLGTCSGIAIPVAQRFGAKKYSEMRSFVMNGVYLSIFLALFMTILTLLTGREILTLMKTPEDIFQGSYIYMMIIFAGIPCTFLYNVAAGIIRSLGDSRTPFYFLVLSAILNVVLDLILIMGVKMGVGGAALATILAQLVSGILCVIYMIRKYEILHLQDDDEKKLDMGKINVLLGMGVPMGLQFSITAIGTVMMQSAINSLGTIYVASFTAAAKIKQFAMCPYDGFANASATFCSQNLGAKKIDRIYQGVKSSIFAGLLYSIAIGIVLVTVGGKLALIFVDGSEVEVLGYVQQYLTCTGYFYVLLAILNVLRMTIQGLGYSGLSMLAGLSELFARGAMSLFVIPVFGYTAVCFTEQSAWLAAVIVVVVLFYYVMKRIREQMGEV